MLSNFILVGCGAALGAWGRYIVSKLVNRLFSGNFPLATLLINLVGSFILGLLTGLAIVKWGSLLLCTGVLGGLTTFSTLNNELATLWINKDWKNFWTYFIFTYGFGLCLAGLGFLWGLHI